MAFIHHGERGRPRHATACRRRAAASPRLEKAPPPMEFIHHGERGRPRHGLPPPRRRLPNKPHKQMVSVCFV
jgi:hypothetical protein